MTDQHDISDAEFEAALDAGRRSADVHATALWYDRDKDTIRIELDTGVALSIPRRSITELARLDSAPLAQIELSPAGTGLAIDAEDVHLGLAGLIAAQLPDEIFAAAWARRGGRSSSPAKAQAARSNGRRGGRPRKTASAR